jgi:predicted N-acetyltransferase YhbS
MEGPRGLYEEELPSLGRLVDTVFMPDQPGRMLKIFPSLFNKDNLENLLVFTDRGAVISHVGMTQRYASLAGCTVKVACIGAVATYEGYRGNGLATQLMEKAVQKSQADGVDFMLISGDRGLYRRLGAADVGLHHRVLITKRVAEAFKSADATVEPLADIELPAVMAAYRLRVARFIRPLDDWRWFLETRTCACRDAELLVVRNNGIFCGYLLIATTMDKGILQVMEFAGDPFALASAFAAAIEQRSAVGLTLVLQEEDRALRELAVAAGIALEPVHFSGTLLLINTMQLLKRLQPYFAERAGILAADQLRFEEEGEQFTLTRDLDTHSVKGTQAFAELLFGNHERPLDNNWTTSFFPAPALRYGINYV